MKSAANIVLIGLFGALLALVSSQAMAAEDTTVLTEKQIEAVVEACDNSQQQLRRLHASDALIRVNIGQEYNNLSSRLMAPLNSRIALNGLDGVDLSQATVDYNQAVTDFQDLYIIYEASVSAAIRTDCKKNPVGYYSHITNSRRLRAEVRDAIEGINDRIGQYETKFTAFSRDILKESK